MASSVRGLPILFIVVAGCWPFELDPDRFDVDSVTCTGVPRDFAGTWTLRGTGARQNCDDERLDTDRFDLRSSELVFRTVNDGFFFDRDASNVPDTFDILDTELRSRCVEFTTVESTNRGSVRIDWLARGTHELNQVEGRFEGQGPGSCEIAGNFRATVITPD
jgi:hypothetical protein